jgi:hypothetical protein
MKAGHHANARSPGRNSIEAIRKSGGKANVYAIPEMLTYLHRINYTPDQLNALNVLHVTGTKGKGSTCAFVERIVRGLCEEKGLLGGGQQVKGFEDVDEDEREWVGGVGECPCCQESHLGGSSSTLRCKASTRHHTCAPSVNASESMANPSRNVSLQNTFSSYGIV